MCGYARLAKNCLASIDGEFTKENCKFSVEGELQEKEKMYLNVFKEKKNNYTGLK